MKKIYIFSWVFILFAAASCKKGGFLDTKTTATINAATTFADSTNTMDFLAGLYSDIAYNYQIASAHNLMDYSKNADEGEGRYPAGGNYDKIFTQGTFASGFFNQQQTEWTLFYSVIRNCNIFLANVDKSPLSAAKKKRVKAEARFIRALHTFYAVRSFGGIPLLGDDVFDTDAEAVQKRSTYEECVNYIVSELDAISGELPLSYNGLDFGRITKGACLGLKSRMLLFAASPLYNGGGTAPSDAELQKLLCYPAADNNRWEKARLAAKAVMDMGIYSLVTDNTTKWGGNPTGLGYGFYKTFITRNNSEFILPRPLPTGKQMETYGNPKSRGGANFYCYPTQELVDWFPTINGKPIATDIKSASNPLGYDASNPYVNRDPRLSATVVYNGGLLFLNSTKTLSAVDTYVGAASGDGIVALSSNTATITGYYWRKMCDENASVQGGNNVDRSLPVIRYAEILLNYAEATNETGNAVEAMNTLKLLRARAGINAGADGMYGLPASPAKDDARLIIQNERAIELAFEQHRIWDIRRWKLGPQLDGKFVHGMQITRTGTTYTYKKIDVRTRYFKDNYYYFPIPKDDVTINPSLLQNPGY
ncbi:RagB/SusD family nutrient uptake outer membrane protein [Hufsiella ginkgonis]|uniref:RagB/SusD family nutrient uptake outer membrane protein n=1 Tax=Hufsiella ginkgonis TaxID=2695274 RepID=A0A7K1XTD4_9SPHI|nr:RagB/SusD family nutrient uptake outer membrane protein [Hufsiella ginkgonis]MXV13776.1 RagB/SusD family nutrient uptake outer membrane protein [Hufsiella ginkgonis]